MCLVLIFLLINLYYLHAATAAQAEVRVNVSSLLGKEQVPKERGGQG